MIKEISDAESRRAHLYTLKGMCVLRSLIISEGFCIFQLEPVKKDWNECLLSEVPVENMAKKYIGNGNAYRYLCQPPMSKK